MNHLIDRILERVAPKVTASACSGAYFCNAAGHPGRWFRYCCPDGGCTWSKISSHC